MPTIAYLLDWAPYGVPDAEDFDLHAYRRFRPRILNLHSRTLVWPTPKKWAYIDFAWSFSKPYFLARRMVLDFTPSLNPDPDGAGTPLTLDVVSVNSIRRALRQLEEPYIGPAASAPFVAVSPEIRNIVSGLFADDRAGAKSAIVRLPSAQRSIKDA